MTKWVRIGASIRRLRKRAKMSQQALADAVGLSRVAISNIEKGRSRTKAERLMDFAGALGVSLDELTGFAVESHETYIRSLAEAIARIAELEQSIENLKLALGDRDRALNVIGGVIERWRGGY